MNTNTENRVSNTDIEVDVVVMYDKNIIPQCLLGDKTFEEIIELYVNSNSSPNIPDKLAVFVSKTSSFVNAVPVEEVVAITEDNCHLYGITLVQSTPVIKDGDDAIQFYHYKA